MDFKKHCPLCQSPLSYTGLRIVNRREQRGIKCTNPECEFQGPRGDTEVDSWSNWYKVVDAIRNNIFQASGYQGVNSGNAFCKLSNDGRHIMFIMTTTGHKLRVSVEDWNTHIVPLMPKRKIPAIKELVTYAEFEEDCFKLHDSKKIVEFYDDVNDIIIRSIRFDEIANKDITNETDGSVDEHILFSPIILPNMDFLDRK